MARTKLILICQSGGEFRTNDDGSLYYSGGDAHAVDVNHDTLFDDLKLKLAEMCNFEHASLSMKYFIPGNKRTLITLSTDNCLKRMFDFYGDAVTAEVYISGKKGFDKLSIPANRAIALTVAETVPPAVASTSSNAAFRSTVMPIKVTPIVSRKKRTPVSSKKTRVVSSHKRTQVESSDKRTPEDGKSKYSAPRDAAEGQAADAIKDEPTVDDIYATPADAVKRRRRTASLNGQPSVKKNIWNSDADSSVVDVYVEQQLESPAFISGSSQSYHSPASDNSDFAPLDNSVVSWKGGITGEGQDFQNVAEFRAVLQKYSISRRFGYRFKKNDTNRASVVCAAEGCSWKIHASFVPSEQVFRIKKMNSSHTCGGESWKAKHSSKGWLVGVIKDKLSESPHQKPKDIANEIQRDFGIELSYTQVWRGLEDARVQLQGSHKGAYSQLQWFCDKLMEANPGSSAKLLIDTENKFQCMFVSFHASIDGFQRGCRPLLFLDSTPLRSKYHEVLLTATGIDGNNDFFPVAFAVVDVENDGNWRWFLEHLKSAISTPTPLTFVSDKDKSLRNPVLDVFGDCHHGYSIFHLLDSFMFSLKGPFGGEGKSTLLGYLLSAAHAVRLESFRKSMEQIKRVSVHAYDWLMQNEPEYWAKAVFKGEHYDHVTVDVAELYVEWIEEVPDKPILQKVEALTCKMMELLRKRQMMSNEWRTILTPSKEQKIHQDTEKARCMKVLFSSDTIFEVHDDSVHVVNIETRKCTCLEWEITGLPCRHAMAVFISVHRSPYDFCSKYFTVDNYRATYSRSIVPVIATFGLPEEEGGDQEPAAVLPPTTPRPPVQKEKRHKAGEFRRTVTCARCKCAGHNKVTCKEPLASA